MAVQFPLSSSPRQSLPALALALIFISLLPLPILAGNLGGPYNGLASTPQMGWDNWNAFGCNINETSFLDTARKIVDYGLRDLGYQYIILDDCWSNGRDAAGQLRPNTTQFPHGMKYIGDTLHNLSLKFGMYSSAGKYTCAQYAASLGNEKQDAATFASWGVDYLKYDNCYNEGQEGTSLITYTRYKAMSDALNATGRPILYSMCNWGRDYPWNWAATMANSWRITGDIYDDFDRPDARCPCTTYDCTLPGYHCSVMNILNKAAPIANKGQPGGWNDLDILEVGNSGMTDDEYKLHISMWAMIKSPLLMGNDFSTIDAPTLSLLSNPALLAISQDPLGIPPFRVWTAPAVQQNNTYSTDLYTAGETSFWTGQLNGGDYVVAFVNGVGTQQSMSATMDDIFVDLVTTGSNAPVPQLMETWNVYDIWGYRMDNATASGIIHGSTGQGMGVSQVPGMNATVNRTSVAGVETMNMRFNATAMSYADAAAANVTAVLGKKIGALAPGGTLSARVPRHGVAIYRLRSQGKPKMKRRDEL